jgi:Ca-activated chloride channel family protein
LAVALAAGAPSFADENVMIVFDGSNSMWGQIEGTAKIVIARDLMENLLGDWVDDRSVGLMAYGHRTRGDCSDIEVLVEPGQAARETILERINGVTPTGKTPLSDAVEQAATALSYTDQPATVVLISDGLESCERDPCALAEALEKGGVGFTAHVVGFGLGSDEDTSSLACIAENTGGQYITATNADELGAALSTVGNAVAETVPEPNPEPEAPAVLVQAPDTAVGGTNIKVTWASTVAERDYITIVPVGTDPDQAGVYVQVGKASEVVLAVPGDEGLYEVRYFASESRETLGHDTIEITKPDVALTAPDIIETGGALTVSWTPTLNARDRVTIVPLGTDDGVLGNYIQVGQNTEKDLVAPSDPGLYELRYVLNVDRKTVGTRAIEVSDPAVTLQAPDTTLTGADFDVSWAGTVNEKDYITIVPMGADEGTLGNYFSVSDASKKALKAPADTGLYEVRYVLREGRKTLASATIEVTEPEITVSAPETVLAGSKFDVSWTGTVNPRDFVTIVPMGAEEGQYGNYQNVSDADTKALNAPADPGLYEVRYILREGRKTMASATVEVTEPDVTISSVTEVRAGTKLRVSWTGAVATDDFINLVPAGSEDSVTGVYGNVRDKSELDLNVPDETGLYEVRYVLREGRRVVARQTIEVLPKDAALNTGASIEAPETTAPGSTIEVSWSTDSDSADQRITLAQGEQAIFTWISAEKITGAPPIQITVPDEPGIYEIRLLDLTNKAVLSRKVIQVQ